MQAGQSLFIDGKWIKGEGRDIISVDPATGEQIWAGKGASLDQTNAAIAAAKKSLPAWAKLSLEQRSAYLAKFTQVITDKQADLVDALSQEAGKPTWEAKTEIAAMIGKFDASKQAYADRCKEITKDMQGYTSITKLQYPH